MAKNLIVRYEGGDADQHKMDMRQLGESLIGIERLINTGLYVLENGCRPGHGIKLKTVVRVSTPNPGSVEFIPDLVAGVYSVLSNTAIQKQIGMVLSGLVRIPLLSLAGRKDDAKECAERLEDLRESARRADKADERRHIEQVMAHRNQGRAIELAGKAHDLLYQQLSHQWAENAARNAVSPVGRSCACMDIADGETTETITPIMAQAIRSGKDYFVGETRIFSLTIDGFDRDRSILRVVNPYSPDRKLKANVLDPVFKEVPNIYTNAAAQRRPINLFARPLFRGNRLTSLDILGRADNGRMVCERCRSEMELLSEMDIEDGRHIFSWRCPNCSHTQDSEGVTGFPFEEDYGLDRERDL